MFYRRRRSGGFWLRFTLWLRQPFDVAPNGVDGATGMVLTSHATHHTIFNSSARAARPAGKEVASYLSTDAYEDTASCSITGFEQRAKSSGSNIWRTSVSPSQPGQYFLWSSMKRTADSIASCFDFNSNWA